MMDRRLFLKLTGLTVAASAIEALPVAAEAAPAIAPAAAPARAQALPVANAPFVQRLAIREPGEYRIAGLVRLDEPTVQISGISNSQQISRSGTDGAASPIVSFSSLEYFDRAGQSQQIVVHGGRIESVSIVPIVFE